MRESRTITAPTARGNGHRTSPRFFVTKINPRQQQSRRRSIAIFITPRNTGRLPRQARYCLLSLTLRYANFLVPCSNSSGKFSSDGPQLSSPSGPSRPNSQLPPSLPSYGSSHAEFAGKFTLLHVLDRTCGVLTLFSSSPSALRIQAKASLQSQVGNFELLAVMVCAIASFSYAAASSLAGHQYQAAYNQSFRP